MKPNWYFDLEVLPGSVDSGLAAPVLRGRLLAFLHSFFRERPETYAVAIPDGLARLRVFASERDDLDLLARYLQSLPWVRDYAWVGYPNSVPMQFSGKWYAFERYRIPSERSDRHEGVLKGALRAKRLKKALSDGMDYFRLNSTSTGQQFSLFVRRLEVQPGVSEAKPNSYGFSSPSRPFGLPDLP